MKKEASFFAGVLILAIAAAANAAVPTGYIAPDRAFGGGAPADANWWTGEAFVRPGYGISTNGPSACWSSSLHSIDKGRTPVFP